MKDTTLACTLNTLRRLDINELAKLAAQASDAVSKVRGTTALPNSALLASFGCVLVAMAFAMSSLRFQHWFIIPTTVCGVLAATDAIDWIRGKLDMYDPIGAIGAFSVHFFFLAPLLHVQGQ